MKAMSCQKSWLFPCSELSLAEGELRRHNDFEAHVAKQVKHNHGCYRRFKSWWNQITIRSDRYITPCKVCDDNDSEIKE